MMSRHSKIAPMLFILPAIPILLAQSTDEKAVQTTLERLVAMQRAWGIKMNTAGASLDLKELSRGTANGHTLIKYRMLASGLPTDKIYSLVLWQTGGQPQTNLSGVTVDESGIAICAGTAGRCGTPDKPNDPIDLDMMGGLGEVKRIGLVSSDKSVSAFASAVPFPIRATDRGCVLEATLVTPNAEAMMLSAKGFKPGAALDIESVSEGEKQHPPAKADANGNCEWVVLPFKKGLAMGRTQVSVHSGACNPALSFAWGTGSYVLQ